MASKTVPTKKKSTTATNEPQEAPITTVKKNCPNLSQSGTIGYAISISDSGAIKFSLISSSGSGHFSKAKVGLDQALASMAEFEKKHPLTSLALKDVYQANTSVNSWSYLMACFLEEQLVEPHPDHPRRFKLADPGRFLASIEELKATHSTPRKRKPKAKS